MKRATYRILMGVLACAATGAPAFAGGIDFGVVISGEIAPGVYGRVDLTNRPAPPPVVYAQPVMIEPPPPDVVIEPLYLHVPPDHARHWREHCFEYYACNRPVFFVRSAEYAPGYHRGHPERDWHAGDERRFREEHIEYVRRDGGHWEPRDGERWEHREGGHWDRHDGEHWDHPGEGRGHEKHRDDRWSRERGDDRGDDRGHDRGHDHDH